MWRVLLFAVLFLNGAAVFDDLENTDKDLLEDIEVPEEISKRWYKEQKVIVLQRLFTA